VNDAEKQKKKGKYKNSGVLFVERAEVLKLHSFVEYGKPLKGAILEFL
jgi:hypothetical protein